MTYLMGLGATKAGTSWLYDQLSGHPDCHFRTIKELHYFNTAHDGRWDGAVRAVKVEIGRFSSLLERQPGVNDDYRHRHLADLTDWLAVLKRRVLDLPAYLAYLATGRRAQTRLMGDITPAYGLLPEARLTEMQAIAPGTRFVYLMRDPVARLWSHVRMIAERMAPIKEFRGEFALELLRAICAGDRSDQAGGIVARGDYVGALGRLDRALDPARLLVMFQEQMMTVPGLEQLASFLGISPIRADLDRKVHEGFAFDLPDADRKLARNFLAPQYDYVGVRMGALPPRWHASLKEGCA